jgi:hypothetical protein
VFAVTHSQFSAIKSEILINIIVHCIFILLHFDQFCLELINFIFEVCLYFNSSLFVELPIEKIHSFEANLSNLFFRTQQIRRKKSMDLKFNRKAQTFLLSYQSVKLSVYSAQIIDVTSWIRSSSQRFCGTEPSRTIWRRPLLQI